MKIDIDTSSIHAAMARMRGLAEKKVKTAAIAALNDAAYAGYKATQDEMRRVFDRPTPWVIGGVRYVKARQDRIEAIIDFDKWGNKTNVTVEKILAAEIFGGKRKLKRHEIALQRAGAMPAGMAIVPGPAADMDQYGNMRASQIVQIMSFFRAFPEAGYKANSTAATRTRLAKDKKNGQRGFAYFALGKTTNGLKPGIYQRFSFAAGSAVRPVVFFIPLPSYRQRLRFYELGEKAARDMFDQQFQKYLGQMLSERGL